MDPVPSRRPGPARPRAGGGDRRRTPGVGQLRHLAGARPSQRHVRPRPGGRGHRPPGRLPALAGAVAARHPESGAGRGHGRTDRCGGGRRVLPVLSRRRPRLVRGQPAGLGPGRLLRPGHRGDAAAGGLDRPPDRSAADARAAARLRGGAVRLEAAAAAARTGAPGRAAGRQVEPGARPPAPPSLPRQRLPLPGRRGPRAGARGRRETPVMPLADSIAVAETSDAIRDALGLRGQRENKEPS